MPTRSATSRSVTLVSPEVRATSHAASRISRRVRARRAAFRSENCLSPLGATNTSRRIAEGRRPCQAESAGGRELSDPDVRRLPAAALGGGGGRGGDAAALGLDG